jgi:hypothetical protein
MAEKLTVPVDRTFPRLSRHGRIAFQVVQDPQAKLAAAGLPEAQFQNICGGGIRFQSRSPVDPGRFVAVRIELPDLPDSILALGRVVACEPPPATEKRWDLSVEFFWTGWAAPESESVLHRFIREHV